eukprot:TRINITY_DN1362_c0_g2_i3.p1 TRINITY_DN1362_c0_g2~~TRINITY_DN1362_c0_g2_i3.p1  ORF type:complete len:701 (-),score=147.87 TRINITY_DN1362_c0_g2_i3:103-2205(-)
MATESERTETQEDRKYDTEEETESEGEERRTESVRSASPGRRDGTESVRTATRSESPRSERSRSRTPRSETPRSVSDDGSRRGSYARSEDGSEGYPYDDLESEEALHKRRFAELPQANLYTERRLIDDPYAKGLHNHIESLSHHIERIQRREIDTLANFSQTTFGKDKALELDKENKYREDAIRDIADIRRERMKYRAMLFDAVQDRNNLLESREVQRREERLIKNRADRIEPWRGVDLYLLLFFASQVAIVILYIIFMDFTNNPLYSYNVINIIGPYQRLVYFYNYWVDIAFFIFVGLILMSAFLRKYHYSAIGQTFLIAAFSFQWALLWNGFFKWAEYGTRNKISLETDSIILSLYTVATVVIAYGAIVGRATPLQSLIFAFFLTGFQCLNYFICVMVLKAVDNGGAMTIHMFGAFFGIACSLIMGFTDKTRYTKDYADGDVSYKYWWNNNQRPSYFGEILMFIGALVVIVFFPSFNAAFSTTGQAQGRVVVNTVLALTVSGIVAFLLSWISHVNRFLPFEIVNIAITGGIGLGSGHSLVINGWEAMLVSFAVSITCWIGLRLLTLICNNPENLPGTFGANLWGKLPRDTRGVFFSHGFAGWIGGLASIIAIAAYNNETRFGQSYDQQFHSGLNQAARNTYCWLISWFLALFLGIVTGFGLWLVELLAPAERYPGVRKPKLRKYHDEAYWWDLPLDID